MTETTDSPRRIESVKATLAVAATALVAWLLSSDAAALLRGVTGDTKKNDLPDLYKITEALVGVAGPVTIATAPLALCAGAAMWQWGGPQASRRAVPLMWSAVGAVIVVFTARGLAA